MSGVGPCKGFDSLRQFINVKTGICASLEPKMCYIDHSYKRAGLIDGLWQ